MKRLLMLVVALYLMAVSVLLCGAVASGIAAAAATDAAVLLSHILDIWVVRKFCSALFGDACHRAEDLLSLSRFWRNNRAGDEKLVPIVPPSFTGFVGDVVVPEGADKQWRYVEGQQRTIRGGGIDGDGGYAHHSGRPCLLMTNPDKPLYFPAPQMALPRCYREYLSASLSTPSDFYAWVIRVSAEKMVWGSDGTASTESIVQPYLCVIYRAAIEEEIAASAGEMLPHNPYSPTLSLPGHSVAQQVVERINHACNEQYNRAIVEQALGQFLSNIWSGVTGQYRIAPGRCRWCARGLGCQRDSLFTHSYSHAYANTNPNANANAWVAVFPTATPVSSYIP